jgi:hypothetical protein
LDGIANARPMPSGIHRQHAQREDQLTGEGVLQIAITQDLAEPVHAHEHVLLGADDVLHRVVHHRHQRQDGGERHTQKHRQDQEPRLVVERLVHRPILSSSE